MIEVDHFKYRHGDDWIRTAIPDIPEPRRSFWKPVVVGLIAVALTMGYKFWPY